MWRWFARCVGVGHHGPELLESATCGRRKECEAATEQHGDEGGSGGDASHLYRETGERNRENTERDGPMVSSRLLMPAIVLSTDRGCCFFASYAYREVGLFVARHV